MKHLNRTLAVSVASALSAMAPGMAWSIGFGRVDVAAVLGQPLDFTIPVRVDADERFDSRCAHAQVWFGDSQVLPSSVRTEVTRVSDVEFRVRVRTTSPVSEPLVEIGLAAGCEQSFTRRFTAFADPPGFVRGADVPAAPATTVAQAPGAQPAGEPSAATAAHPAESRGRAIARGASHATVARAPARPHPAPASRTPAAPTAPAPAVVAAAAPPPVPGSAPDDRRANTVARASAPAGQGARLVLDDGRARLGSEARGPASLAGSAPVSVASASPGTANSDIDDPDARRLRTLEQNLEALRRESQASRDQTAALTARLARAESRADWLPWLMAALGLSLATIGGLGWRLRQATRPRHARPWFEESLMPGARPGETRPATASPVRESRSADEITTPVAPPRVPILERDAVVPSAAATAAVAPAPVADLLPATPPVPPPAPTPPASLFGDDLTATRPLSRAALAAALGTGQAAAPRELSVEELLDLEQQADFFIALGQEDAAVDLLMSHLRSAGGQSPLPYTKLLEIYRRQGDRAAYERMRARFNRRFNAYAPDWDVGPGAGRLLEDYPETVAAVQAVWHSPIDAMAMLEALLFKRDDTSELFDLPAYHDILLLYSLARDLWQQSGEDRHALVDVLLPLEDASAAPTPTAAPRGPERASGFTDPWADPPLPQLDETLMPLAPLDEPRTEAHVPSPLPFEPLPDLPLEGGVQATLDTSHLETSGAPARGDASNDEIAPPPGARREPGSRR